MHWFGGSIAEAVTLSKQKNAIFVVFIAGDNEQSTEMSATINSRIVVSRLSNQEQFLAVMLKSGTPNYTHFAQIYQFVPVPSLFFIGRNGTPLEVVCAGVEPANLASRIDRILAEHYKDKPIQPSTSQQLREQTNNLLQSEAASVNVTSNNAKQLHEKPETSSPPAKIQKIDNLTPEKGAEKAPEPKVVEKAPEPKVAEKAPEPKVAEKAPEPKGAEKTQEYEVVCDGDVCVRRPKDSQGASTSAQGASPSVPAPQNDNEQPSSGLSDEKMERAKELLEARRREKAEKEKELQKQKELERRTTGQGVAELKRWQAEQEMKQLQEERKREKLENNLARQRILEQIAQDRAERKARDTPAVTTAPTQQVPVANTVGDAQTHARIQFKMPDGTSHTAQFDATDTLATVHRYVADNLQLSSNQFTLWTAFPRQQLNGEESTLNELHLVPSAALLVMSRGNNTVRPSPAPSVISFITTLLTTLIWEPTLQVYNWVRSRLFPPPTSPPPSVPRAGVQEGRGNVPTHVRRRGNVHRIPGDAPDDDNNTWNGNSTQQM